MEINIYKDYGQLSVSVADTILTVVKNKPGATICLATGDTPRLAYELLVKKAAEENIDFSKCRFVALDEWVGIAADKEGSCDEFLHRYLFQPLNFTSSQIHLFDGMAANLEEECRKMDEVIANGGIDLMLVGVGVNGHIGFNEPGVGDDFLSHVINLDEITLAVGQKYFTESTELKQGITLGLRHILHSRQLILMANGSKKAEVIQKAVEGPVTTDLPASFVKAHTNGYVFIDEAAAALLSKVAGA